MSSIDLSHTYLTSPSTKLKEYLTQSLGWIINQKSELKPAQVFSFVGYEYHLDSALVKPTQERWIKLQDLILHLKSKHYFDCKMFDVAYWVAWLNGENGPGGTPSHEALSVSPQGALEISSVAGQPPSLDRDHFSSPRVLAKSLNVMKDAVLHPKDHSIQVFIDQCRNQTVVAYIKNKEELIRRRCALSCGRS